MPQRAVAELVEGIAFPRLVLAAGLGELVIAVERQNKGIGTAVITVAIERARARSVPIVLGTLHRNRAANLYRRLGFVENGRTDTHTLFPLDTS